MHQATEFDRGNIMYHHGSTWIICEREGPQAALEIGTQGKEVSTVSEIVDAIEMLLAQGMKLIGSGLAEDGIYRLLWL